MAKPGAASVARSRRSSASMSLQPAIPWQVTLPQSLPPLHRPGSECAKVVLPVENFAANGEHGLNCLCQPRGQPQHRASSLRREEFRSSVPPELKPIYDAALYTVSTGKKPVPFLIPIQETRVEEAWKESERKKPVASEGTDTAEQESTAT